jgi:hypothetical protein
MSTRANITIITRQGKFQFQGNSSMYPSNTMEDVFKFATSTAHKFKNKLDFHDEPDSRDLSNFIENCGLTLGQIGNPSYFYEIDFVEKKIRVWDYKMRWINAPENWKERGWNCYEGKNGKAGWYSFVKGKMLLQLSFREMVSKVVDGEVSLNKTKLKKSLVVE